MSNGFEKACPSGNVMVHQQENEAEERPIDYCDNCNEAIWEGDKVIEVTIGNDEFVCCSERCVYDFQKEDEFNHR